MESAVGNTNPDAIQIPKQVLQDLLHRLTGFQNTHLILQERELEVKRYRKKCEVLEKCVIDLQTRPLKKAPQPRGEISTEKQGFEQPRSYPGYRRRTEPSIFIFPDVSASLPASEGMTQRQNSRTKGFSPSSMSSNSLEVDGDGDKWNQHGSVESGRKLVPRSGGSGIATSQEPVYHQEGQMYSLMRGQRSLPVHIPVPGVSEQIFNNVINELVKTKRCLNNLLKEKNTDISSYMHHERYEREMTTMRSENQQLRAEIKDLKKQVESKSEEYMVRPEQEIPAAIQGCMGEAHTEEDSFELSSNKVGSLCAHSCTQTDEETGTSENTSEKSKESVLRPLKKENMELKRQCEVLSQQYQELLKTMERESAGFLQQQNVALDKDNRRLKAELKELSDNYSHLNSNFKEVSKRMNDEKQRCQRLENELHHERELQRSAERSKLMEIIGQLRAECEMLNDQKIKLEKELKLNSPYQPPSPQQVQQHTAGSNTHSGGGHSQYSGGGHSHHFGRSSSRASGRHPSSRQSSGTSEHLGTLLTTEQRTVAATADTNAHEVYTCDNCLSEFQDLTVFLKHVQKCIP